MSASIELEIAHLAIETSLEREQAERLGASLELAFLALAERLRALPGGSLARLQDLVIDRLELELDDPERLLGPAGPELLADRLFDQLLARSGGRR